MHGYITAVGFFLAVSVLGNDTCYQRRSDQIVAQPNWFSCGAKTAISPGGAQLCCRDGDLCGQDSICRSPDVVEGMSASYKQTWATHNVSGHGYWACCGNYDCADGPPTTRRFQAVSPADWTQISQAGSSGGLSTTIKIVIGVVVGVVVLALVAAVAFCMFFRRKRTRSQAKQPAFARTVKKQYEQIGPQGDVLMQAPFVAGENQPYSRPSSPMPSQQALMYSDGPHLPPAHD